MLGDIDIVLLPIDTSHHVMGWEHVESIIERLRPKVIVPHHYYIWDVTQRQALCNPPSHW